MMMGQAWPGGRWTRKATGDDYGDTAEAAAAWAWVLGTVGGRGAFGHAGDAWATPGRREFRGVAANVP